MTHLETLTKAFDDMGWIYLTLKKPEGWTYVILTNEKEKPRLEAAAAANLDLVLANERWFEFDANGSTASYP